jgi:iron complex outermembrane receptor protein
MRKYLLSLFISVFTLCAALAQVANAQIHITGKVIDTITREPLVGAAIVVKGTTTATTASLDGSFKLKVPSGDQTIVVTFVGYVPQTFHVGDADKNLGTVLLSPNSSSMKEVTITADVAIDRKTPVAVTTISQEFIEEHIGNGDIPNLLIGVPGVYATDQGGGYGDQRVSIRGFSSKSNNGNVAYTVNGIPVNDPETGAVYWSDFSGITDVARSIQVQRGIGASKIIVPAFGGTINVTTRTTDQQAGGFVSEGIGSDGWEKTAVMVSTGLDKNGWAATFEGSRTQGAYPFDGSNFKGYDYFFNLSKILTPNQTISLTLIGTQQTHGARLEQPLTQTVSAAGVVTPGYTSAPQGTAWNNYYGIKDGKDYNPDNNFYSEPILSINHDWTINSKSSLSTVLYGMIGDGGGGYFNFGSSTLTTVKRLGGPYSPIDYTSLETANAASATGASSAFGYAAHSHTDWVGLRSTYRTTLGKYIDLSAGLDLRYYVGDHYENITDLMGGNFVSGTRVGAEGTDGTNDINNPNQELGVGSKYAYFNRDFVETEGAFAQAEYSKDNFSLFLTATGSEQGYKRTDFFNYLDSDPNQTSRWVNFTTFQVKGGANYNLNENMNVFANVGYLTKPPYVAGIFEAFTNVVNANPVTEKLFDYELGYNFKTSFFSAKFDAYRTSYNDRTLSVTEVDPTTGSPLVTNVSGLNAMYQGLELELNYRPVQQILIGGMASIQDNYYTANAGPATITDQTGKIIGTQKEIFLKNQKVGDAPQGTAQAFANFNVVSQLKIGVSCNYYWNNIAYVPFSGPLSSFVTAYTAANVHPYQVPNYALWKMNATFKFKMAGFDSELIGTVNNLLNTKAITDAEDYSGTGTPGAVYYQLGRTFTTTLKMRF